MNITPAYVCYLCAYLSLCMYPSLCACVFEYLGTYVGVHSYICLSACMWA
jgi:hypothetical protein